MLWLVASPLDSGACLVAESGGVAQQRLRASLPEAGVVVQPGGVHHPCGGILAGVQPALRPPLRVEVDQSENAAMVCRPRPLNSLHDLRPDTLVPRPSYYEELPAVHRAGNSSLEQTYTNAVHVLLSS